MNITELLKQHDYKLVMDVLEVKYKVKNSHKFALYKNKNSDKEVLEFIKLLVKNTFQGDSESYFYRTIKIYRYPYDEKSKQIALVTIGPYRDLLRLKLDPSLVSELHNFIKD